MDNNSEVRCPTCGSNQITANKKGFSGKKAVAGALLTGGIGVLAGTIGSGSVVITCLACGHTFKPGEGALRNADGSLKGATDEFKQRVLDIVKTRGKFNAINYCTTIRSWPMNTAVSYVDKIITEDKAEKNSIAIAGMSEADRQIADTLVNSGLHAAVKKLQELKGISFKDAAMEVDAFSKEHNIRAKGACFVATACYGDYDAPEVRILRNYRDFVLSKSVVGRWGIKIYYKVSPSFAKSISKSEKVKYWVREHLLNRAVALAKRAIKSYDY